MTVLPSEVARREACTTSLYCGVLLSTPEKPVPAPSNRAHLLGITVQESNVLSGCSYPSRPPRGERGRVPRPFYRTVSGTPVLPGTLECAPSAGQADC